MWMQRNETIISNLRFTDDIILAATASESQDGRLR